jgi:uncharacterized protein YllA (UPF0747 family)
MSRSYRHSHPVNEHQTMANLIDKTLEKIKSLLHHLSKHTEGEESEPFPQNQKWEERIKEWKDQFGDRQPDTAELLQYLDDHEDELFYETRKLNRKYWSTVLKCLDWGKDGPRTARFSLGDETIFVG